MPKADRCPRRKRPGGPSREIAYASEYTQRTLRDDPVPVRDDARAGRVAEAHQIGALGRKALPWSEPEARIVAVDDAVAELDLDALDEIVRHEVVEHGAGGLTCGQLAHAAPRENNKLIGHPQRGGHRRRNLLSTLARAKCAVNR